MGWSDWKADWSDDVLARIVALLFALANLADLASRFPARRRREALGFICRGEAKARAFIVGMALEHRTEMERRHDSDEVPAAPDAPVEDDEPAFFDDAASLAARLRVLAFMLWFLAVQAGRGAHESADPRMPRRKPVGRSVPVGLSAHATGNVYCRRQTRRKIDPG